MLRAAERNVTYLRGIAPARKRPAVVFVIEDARTLQPDHGIDKAGAEQRLVRVGQRQLVRGTRRLFFKDIHVVGMDQRRLHGLREQRRRVMHKELVERIVFANENGQRVPFTAASAPGLLPDARDGARVTCQHRRIEVAYVDAQLKRIGGRDAEQSAVE